MFAIVGIVGLSILAAAAIWMFYVAGRRGRAQENVDRAANQRAQNAAPKQTRAEGRGDL